MNQPDTLLETKFLETVILDMQSSENEKIQRATNLMEDFYARSDCVQILL